MPMTSPRGITRLSTLRTASISFTAAGLETERCGWWIEDSLEALTAALDHAMSLDRSALAEMGARGRAWMERDFGWTGVAEQMIAVYRWLLGRGERPACVIES